MVRLWLFSASEVQTKDRLTLEQSGEAAFWSLMLLVALPAALLLLRLDLTADRPERLRGLSQGPPPDPELLSARAGGMTSPTST